MLAYGKLACGGHSYNLREIPADNLRTKTRKMPADNLRTKTRKMPADNLRTKTRKIPAENIAETAGRLSNTLRRMLLVESTQVSSCAVESTQVSGCAVECYGLVESTQVSGCAVECYGLVVAYRTLGQIETRIPLYLYFRGPVSFYRCELR